jgi:lysine 2,3-aminomutase
MPIEFKSLEKIDHFTDVPDSDWQDWRWQMRKALKTLSDYKTCFTLSEQEERAFNGDSNFQIQTTPYYASLAEDHPNDPIRKIFTPNSRELSYQYQQMLDPLGEQKNRPARRIIHRYPDRALFLVTDYCSVYCRYCTRKHFTGGEAVFPKAEEYEEALNYIKKTTKIREVILSGGDPLTLSNAKLEKVLADLRKISHVELIRIGSRMPTVNPFRIDQELVDLFKKHKPVYLMTHFNHPKELSKEAADALELVVDHGTPVFNQLVLLNGVNNHEAIVRALSRRLLYLRVKPYYMFQCDPSEGTDHLRTSIEDSLKIQNALWGKVSGLMMPNYSIDIPNGGGKTSISPQHLVGVDGNRHLFKGFDGVEAEYVSPEAGDLEEVFGVDEYIEEWEY